MSWDFGMVVDAGGLEPALLRYEANYTYNVSPMFYEALGEGGIGQLDGLTGQACLPILADGIEKMEAEPDKYKAMNPPNGYWGDYEGALELLRDLSDWCRDAPAAMMRIW